MRFSLLAACALLTGVIAAPAGQLQGNRHVVHEKRDHVPANWQRIGKLHPASYVPMRIALAQSNVDKADEYLMDVSHPESLNFGHHWSPEQIADTFAPSREAIDAVKMWLVQAGVTKFELSQGRNWINANVTVDKAEKLLKTKYFEYKHASGVSHVACDDYSVPEDIREHIDFIMPTVHFDTKVGQVRRRDTDIEHNIAYSIASEEVNVASPTQGDVIPFEECEKISAPGLDHCAEYTTPDCLRALYSIPDAVPFNSNNSYGIVEYTPQAYLQEDLDLFFANYSSSLVGRAPNLTSINGGYDQTSEQSFSLNGESDLDLEYAMSLSYPQNITLYQVGNGSSGGSFGNFLEALDQSYCTSDNGDDPGQDPSDCGGVDAANVISTSYSYNEGDLTAAYEIRQCNEYLKLGLAGTTFLFSSGDFGVAGAGGNCPNGQFSPSFPSTCPYVTSVGATQLAPNSSITDPETAAETIIYSGGGFSNVFTMPWYQQSAVESYFANYKPSYGSERYNTSEASRGFPDISANGVNYVVAVDGQTQTIYGTSASAPTVGAILTMINAERLNAGKSSIGFVNPTLYANPGMLNDITSGGNQGCGTAGFEAVDGWDPVTGLGMPDFERMKAVWLALP